MLELHFVKTAGMSLILMANIIAAEFRLLDLSICGGDSTGAIR